jgi:hypothetical protein
MCRCATEHQGSDYVCSTCYRWLAGLCYLILIIDILFSLVFPPTFFFSEFLDPSDKSLVHVIYGAQQLNIYPISILDVTSSRTAEPEYLLCFNVVGVFVDKFGQRTRPDDIRWSLLPLGFGNTSIWIWAFVIWISRRKLYILTQPNLN